MTEINEHLLIRPDWKNPILYRRKWQTGISSALDGNEVRSALLTWPRRTLAYSILSKGFAESSYIRRKMHKNLHNVWGVPFWQDKTVLTSQASSGQNILNIKSTVDRNFEVGGSCILLSPNDLSLYDAGVIVAGGLSPSQITLEEDLAHTWPPYTEVYPVLKARIKTGQTLNVITSRMVETGIEAVEEYDDGIVRNIGDADSFPDYKGFYVFDRTPNLKDGGQKFFHPYDSLFFLGKSYSMSHYIETALGLQANHLAPDKSEIQSILDFFDYQMARLGSFWIPTWQEDLRVTQAFGAGATTLEIESVEFYDYWLGTKTGMHAVFMWPGEAPIYKEIVDSSHPMTDPATITLDEPIGRACSSQELPRLLASFLLFCRFDHDEIEVKYVTDMIGETDLSFRTILDEVPMGES